MNLADASNLQIGSIPSNAAYYGAQKIWSRPEWVEPPRVGLIGFWGLNTNEDLTVDITDSSGSNRTLIESNAGSRPGKIGGCAEFRFDFQWMTAQVPEFLSSQSYAFSMWVNVAEFKKFILVSGSDRPSLSIGGDNSNLRWNQLFSAVQDGGDVNIPNFFQLNTWIHCVFSRTNSGRMQVFKNNILVYDNPTNDFNEPLPVNRINFCNLVTYSSIFEPNFNFNFGDNRFLGKIDAIGFWNRSLTPAEVNYLWNNGEGREI
jgi:hypothetical protein